MIRVAGYCRVSTDGEDQANSFASQQRYFREYIDRHPEWELYDIYADEGITGTSTKKRAQFNRMINDAFRGKFQLILTKEVSRFSRNLLDTISYTRELKTLGIGVIFMNDGFNSLDPDAELRLSIMGSIAQEESRKTSTRVKWGQTRQMERGVVFGTSMLGYDVRNGRITINPDGAEIIRLIFHKYGVEKKGTSQIARELREAGYKTFRNSEVWSNSHLVKILRNEKYVGDLIQKKTITPDYLTHEKKRNRGEEEYIIIPNHHEQIIDRALWNTVQQELKSRNRRNNRPVAHSTRYLFSGKIICGECGGRFVARRKTGKGGESQLRWRCAAAARCGIGRMLRDDVATEALKTAICTIPMDQDAILHNLTKIISDVLSGSETEVEDEKALSRQIQQFLHKKETAIDAYLSGVITKEELERIKIRYDEKITSLRERLEAFQRDKPARTQSDIKTQIQSILACERLSEPFCRNLLEKLTIHRDGSFEIRLRSLPQIWHFQLQYPRKSYADDPRR